MHKAMFWLVVFLAVIGISCEKKISAEAPALLLPKPEQKQLKRVMVFIEGDSSTIPKFINMCRQKGPERGLDFQFVDSLDDPYDYRVVLSTEGSSAWNYAHGNLVVMTSEAKVVFTVTRSNRLTAKGATSALTKEFIKVMSRYLGTHR
jgi:hypothetical protein